jgi:hypothetical protein
MRLEFLAKPFKRFGHDALRLSCLPGLSQTGKQSAIGCSQIRIGLTDLPRDHERFLVWFKSATAILAPSPASRFA